MALQIKKSPGKNTRGLICYIFKRGPSTFIIILGRRDTGKTDLSLRISETLHESSIIKYFATNVKIYTSPFQIDHITNLDDLKFWCTQKKGRKLFIFDEYGKAMRRRSPMSSLNVKLIDELQIMRKYKLSTIAVTVNQKYVDKSALGTDILDGVFFKWSFKNRKVAYYRDMLEPFSRKLYGIPKTSIKFDTWDVAPFQEHGVKLKPRFKTKELGLLWDWSHGATTKTLDVNPNTINRLTRKFIKDTLEKENYSLPS